MTINFQGLTSVIFVGNPGAGKSTLHNALGGSFKSGFSAVIGMCVGEPQKVLCEGRRLRLVDMPGINDHRTAEDREMGESVIDRNLRTILNQLNNGDHYVIFFVIAPRRSGAIPEGDIQVMRIFLKNLQRGPRIGLIITQVHRSCIAKFTAGYVTQTMNRAVIDVVNRAEVMKLEPFQEMHALVLGQHDLQFDENDRKRIRQFILSFVPKQVHLTDMTVKNFDSHLVEYTFEREMAQLLNGSTEQVERTLITTQRLHLKYLASQLRPDLPDNTQFDGAVFCFGQTGAGKSTVMNALCRDSSRGSRRFRNIALNGRHLHLVDDLFPKSLPTNRTMIFYIISPRNGRIEPTDVVLLQLLLNNIRNGPKVGVIFTQVRSQDYHQMASAKYYNLFVEQLHAPSLQFLETTRHLTLVGHDGCFSDQEMRQIQNFVLSFEAQKTEIEFSSILPAEPQPAGPAESTGQRSPFWKFKKNS